VIDLKIYESDRSELLQLNSCTSDGHKGNIRISSAL